MRLKGCMVTKTPLGILFGVGKRYAWLPRCYVTFPGPQDFKAAPDQEITISVPGWLAERHFGGSSRKDAKAQRV